MLCIGVTSSKSLDERRNILNYLQEAPRLTQFVAMPLCSADSMLLDSPGLYTVVFTLQR